MENIENLKIEFISEMDCIVRPGMDKLKAWLLKGDFFEAPASKDHHLNYAGGLLAHSLNVFKLFNEKNERYLLGLPMDSVRLCGLFHDLCKANFYRKGPNGYYYDDKFPIGHGEKSVILLQHFIDLTPEECLIIRWHMAGFDISSTNKGAYYTALKKFPACLALHTADYEATVLMES